MTAALAAAFVAGAVGGTFVRWKLASAWNRSSFPVGTFAVNVLGSFAMGLLANSNAAVFVVVGVGVLGSLTTFSTLSLETIILWRRNAGYSVLYAILTLSAGAAAAYAGLVTAAAV